MYTISLHMCVKSHKNTYIILLVRNIVLYQKEKQYN